MNSDPGFGGAGPLILMILCFGFIAILSTGLLAFWIWMVIDCATKEPSEGNDKIVWLLLIVLLNWLGALLYYFIRRPERIRRFGQ